MLPLFLYKNKGMTLIEVIIVIVLLGIVGAVGSYALQAGLESQVTNQSIIEANWQTLNNLEKMTRQIRAIRSSADITTATSTQLVFTGSDGNSYTYLLSGTNLLLNGSTFMTGVSSLTFSYLDENAAVTTTLASIRYINIALTISQNNATYNIQTSIYPRNLP